VCLFGVRIAGVSTETTQVQMQLMEENGDGRNGKEEEDIGDMKVDEGNWRVWKHGDDCFLWVVVGGCTREHTSRKRISFVFALVRKKFTFRVCPDV